MIIQPAWAKMMLDGKGYPRDPDRIITAVNNESTVIVNEISNVQKKVNVANCACWFPPIASPPFDKFIVSTVGVGTVDVVIVGGGPRSVIVWHGGAGLEGVIVEKRVWCNLERQSLHRGRRLPCTNSACWNSISHILWLP